MKHPRKTACHVCALLLFFMVSAFSTAATPAPRKNPAPNVMLMEADAALHAGEIDLARQRYEKLLSRSPQSPDALRSLGLIALHDGQSMLAQRFLQQALESDPHDPITHATLAALNTASPPALESHLLLLRMERPSPALDFALGNLYARQSRWPEAQQAYFRAYEADDKNPDVTVNLAISLDRLQQHALAAQYYAQALALTATRKAVFNHAVIKARLQALQAP